MMEAARTSETSVDNHFTRQYNPEDSSEHPKILLPVSALKPYPVLYCHYKLAARETK
jgi:hypothetical protein